MAGLLDDLYRFDPPPPPFRVAFNATPRNATESEAFAAAMAAENAAADVEAAAGWGWWELKSGAVGGAAPEPRAEAKAAWAGGRVYMYGGYRLDDGAPPRSHTRSPWSQKQGSY